MGYRIMGVVNVTPDSFSDGGAFSDADAAIAHGLRLAFEGADLLDIGGESTRPGAAAVAAGEECARVLPVIAGLHAADPAIRISVDTPRPRSPPPRSTPARPTSTTSPRSAATPTWPPSSPSAARMSA
jgi:dihydropteroate synthase